MRGIENAVISSEGALFRIWCAIRGLGMGIWTAFHRQEAPASYSCPCYDVEE